MRAMILAAGRGSRMRPFTNTTPKPLVPLAGEPLIAYSLWNLKQAGITDIVINVSYLAEQLMNFLGNGQAFGVQLTYSIEDPILETGGGILKALPLLGDAPFVVVSADIWTEFSFARLLTVQVDLAYAILVPNPPYHVNGDFSLNEQGFLQMQGPRYTFANISVLTPELFASSQPGYFPLAPLLVQAIISGRVRGELIQNDWVNLGTMEEVQRLDTRLSAR